MKKLFVLGIASFMAIILIFSFYASREKAKIASSVLRFHVVAESDSDEDQRLKLKVRDAVLREAGAIMETAAGREEALKLATENKELFKNVAEVVLRKEGCFLPVSVNVEKTYFPLKEYENIRLPGGVYDAVNVRIGKGKGKNWWCIMYPMLCFTDSVTARLEKEGENMLKDELGEERFRLITDTNDEKIKIKFKILELF
ncbi:MAG: stage II sporulation protein R [Clostridia bacterium]|nr:stage II sporulation protein R [Clostridia bacterium]